MTRVDDGPELLHPWPRVASHEQVDHVLVVLSDIEMGAGGPTDDYPDTGFLEELLEAYGRPPYEDLPLTYVFNGDTFDFLKTPVGEREYPTHITEAMALTKLERVLGAHPTFARTLGRILRGSRAPRRAVFLVGNHDQELLFDGVKKRLNEAIGAPGAVSFPGLEWRFGDVFIEHGSQHDPMFAVDPERPFVRHPDGLLLNVPWGTMALLEVAMPHLHELYPLDRLRPHRRVLDTVPEIRDLLLDQYWHYWTRDYWSRLFGETDPLRRVTWTMLREIAYRFGTGDPDVPSSDARTLLRQHADANLVVMGHEHEPALSSWDGRRLLRTGCFRHEYLADLENGEHRPMTKVYAEVFLNEQRVLHGRLAEVAGRPPEVPSVPRDIRSLVPRLREELTTPSQRARIQRAQDAQLAKEGDDATSSLPGFLRTLQQYLERR